MKKYLLILLLIVFITPSVAFASWWNPFTWSWFKKSTPVVQVSTPTPVVNNSSEEIKKLQEQIENLKKQKSLSAPTITNSTSKKESEKPVSSIVDNSAIIQAQIEATLKAREDQNALIAKQKADEQARIDAVKAESDRLMAQQIETERIKAINAQIAKDAEIKIQQQLAKEALQIKQAKLNAINQQIVALNAKFVADVAATRNRPIPMEFINGQIQKLTDQYDIDYAILVSEYQTIQYSN